MGKIRRGQQRLCESDAQEQRILDEMKGHFPDDAWKDPREFLGIEGTVLLQKEFQAMVFGIKESSNMHDHCACDCLSDLALVAGRYSQSRLRALRGHAGVHEVQVARVCHRASRVRLLCEHDPFRASEFPSVCEVFHRRLEIGFLFGSSTCKSNATPWAMQIMSRVRAVSG